MEVEQLGPECPQLRRQPIGSATVLALSRVPLYGRTMFPALHLLKFDSLNKMECDSDDQDPMQPQMQFQTLLRDPKENNTNSIENSEAWFYVKNLKEI